MNYRILLVTGETLRIEGKVDISVNVGVIEVRKTSGILLSVPVNQVIYIANEDVKVDVK